MMSKRLKTLFANACCFLVRNGGIVRKGIFSSKDVKPLRLATQVVVFMGTVHSGT
jgi:hypothetical protein